MSIVRYVTDAVLISNEYCTAQRRDTLGFCAMSLQKCQSVYCFPIVLPSVHVLRPDIAECPQTS